MTDGRTDAWLLCWTHGCMAAGLRHFVKRRARSTWNAAFKQKIARWGTKWQELRDLYRASRTVFSWLGSPRGLGLIVEASTSHSDTPHSVALLWIRDRSVAENSTWHHTTLTTDRHACPGGIRTRNPGKRAAVDLRLRLRGHWDWLAYWPFYWTAVKDCTQNSTKAYALVQWQVT
jgi:hypothetical protein